VLQARRHDASLRRRAIAAKRQPSSVGDAQVCTEDGRLTFLLSRSARGLFVRRIEHEEAGIVTVQCLVISSMEAFRRWCDVEPARLAHPVLFDQLRRYGDDALLLRQ
jgi:hypothetical protein